MSLTTQISGSLAAQASTMAGEGEIVALPCPGFPVVERIRYPLDNTEAEGGTAVLADRVAGRRIEREIDLDLATLTDAEIVELRRAWLGGRGMVLPFLFDVPGPVSTRREEVVFATPLTIDHNGPVDAAARVRLRIVTAPDF